MPRQSEYTDEIAAEICERIADGESLRSVCRDDHMPSKATIMRWIAERPAFQDQYARAREVQADAIFEEMFEIADDGSNDWMDRHGEDGNAGWQLNGEHIQRSRLRVEARKWALARMAPKKYGDKLDLNHGGQADNPVVHRIERKIVRPDNRDR